MSTMLYWGESGQFGPFDVQEDGWPNAGQVMRYFREKTGITAKTFGIRYGKEIRADGEPICERWILEMELENKVPVDIVRRRVIARLLDIPPALLGLATLEETVPPQPQKGSVSLGSAKSTLKKLPIDIADYEKKLHLILHLHRTSHARDLLEDVNADRKALEHLNGQVKGDLRYRVRELLVSNDLLAAKVVRDQRDYAQAYTYANHALQVATRMKDDELVATATYTRGCIQLQWGQFGVVKQGRFQLDRKNIEDAIRDFQDILDNVSSRRASLHPQLHGFTLLQLSRAHSLLSNSLYDLHAARALTYVDQAAEMVGREVIDEISTRMIITGTLSGLHLGGYYLAKADILSTIGMVDQALTELHQFDGLAERTYKEDETRNHAWSHIVHAKVLLSLREYSEATQRAKIALAVCHAIHSVQNTTIISDMYGRLMASSYSTAKSVQELGDMLKDWYGLSQCETT